MIFAGQQQFADVFSRMNAALESTVHSPPELDDLWAEIGSNDVVAALAWPIEWIYVLVHVICHVTPQRESSLGKLQVDAIFLAVANESSKLTAHDVIVENQQEALVELKGIRSLLHELPSAVEELCEDWRDLKRI